MQNPRLDAAQLRRTFAKNLAALGTPIHVTEKLLNHISGAVPASRRFITDILYMDEMREASPLGKDASGRLFLNTPASGDRHDRPSSPDKFPVLCSNGTNPNSASPKCT